jgi:hypothetical protein
MWRCSDNASASGNLVAGIGEHRTAANEDDVEAGDLREWTLVGHRNISIVDAHITFYYILNYFCHLSRSKCPSLFSFHHGRLDLTQIILFSIGETEQLLQQAWIRCQSSS